MARPRITLFMRKCLSCPNEFPVNCDCKKKKYCCLACRDALHPITDPSHAEVDGGYRIIPLSKGQEAKVDDSDYESLMKFNWHSRWNKNTGSYYAQRQHKTGPGARQVSIQMGRQILGVTDRRVMVDHKNHDTLDFRRDNLRLASQTQNAQNAVFRTLPKSGYRGVSMRSGSKKWQARITSNGRNYGLGIFDRAEDASAAYEKAAKQLHGEFYYGIGSNVVLSG